jgi:hypothetical protein
VRADSVRVALGLARAYPIVLTMSRFTNTAMSTQSATLSSFLPLSFQRNASLYTCRPARDALRRPACVAYLRGITTNRQIDTSVPSLHHYHPIQRRHDTRPRNLNEDTSRSNKPLVTDPGITVVFFPLHFYHVSFLLFLLGSAFLPIYLRETFVLMVVYSRLYSISPVSLPP